MLQVHPMTGRQYFNAVEAKFCRLINNNIQRLLFRYQTTAGGLMSISSSNWVYFTPRYHKLWFLVTPRSSK